MVPILSHYEIVNLFENSIRPMVDHRVWPSPDSTVSGFPGEQPTTYRTSISRVTEKIRTYIDDLSLNSHERVKYSWMTSSDSYRSPIEAWLQYYLIQALEIWSPVTKIINTADCVMVRIISARTFCRCIKRGKYHYILLSYETFIILNRFCYVALELNEIGRAVPYPDCTITSDIIGGFGIESAVRCAFGEALPKIAPLLLYLFKSANYEVGQPHDDEVLLAEFNRYVDVLDGITPQAFEEMERIGHTSVRNDPINLLASMPNYGMLFALFHEAGHALLEQHNANGGRSLYNETASDTFAVAALISITNSRKFHLHDQGGFPWIVFGGPCCFLEVLRIQTFIEEAPIDGWNIKKEYGDYQEDMFNEERSWEKRNRESPTETSLIGGRHTLASITLALYYGEYCIKFYNELLKECKLIGHLVLTTICFPQSVLENDCELIRSSWLERIAEGSKIINEEGKQTRAELVNYSHLIPLLSSIRPLPVRE